MNTPLFLEPWRPYMRFLPTIALFAGFILDVFTLDRPDAIFENVVIIGYLLLSASVMVVLQSRVDDGNESRRLILLGILQFAFGNLASALMVLYSRSGTFTGSAIFIGILALLLLGNEVLKDRYARTHLRVVIWFVLFLTYTTIFIPVLLNSIGAIVFMVSVASALGGTLLLLLLLSRVAHTPFSEYKKRILTSVTIITISFAGLYFTNLIPPVPLALKHIGIYHSVVRTNDTYTLTYEPPHFYEFWRSTNKTFTHTAGEPAYCFSSVFAPRRLQTDIRHRWEKYNEATQKWVTVSRIPFPISGGRADGFRGYTQTGQLTPGTWRCNVETARGARIGASVFEVVAGTAKLEETTL